MSNKKRILLSIFSLLLCVFATFAWVDVYVNPEGRYMMFSPKMFTSNDVSMKLYYNDDTTGKYIEKQTISSDSNFIDMNHFDDFYPGSIKKFKAVVENKNTTAVSLSMILNDISCSDEPLGDYIEIGTSKFEGFTSKYPAPDVESRLVSSLDSDDLMLLNNIDVPSDSKVNIYFYIKFSETADSSLIDSTFSIGTFNFIA